MSVGELETAFKFGFLFINGPGMDWMDCSNSGCPLSFAFLLLITGFKHSARGCSAKPGVHVMN